MTISTTTLLEAATLTSLGLVAYHHVGWPILLRVLAARRPRPDTPPPVDPRALPAVTLIMPAHDEAEVIARKLRNLAALDYPPAALRVRIVCDGCTDDTVRICHETLRQPDCARLNAEVVAHTENRGKVAVLNEAITAADTPIVVLTDVSAMLPSDAITRAVAWFRDAHVGAVGGTYRVRHPVNDGERAYWAVQTRIKRDEAALGAPLGLHGAFLAIRRVAWRPLPADTINDDFVMPMRMVSDGWRVAYDHAITAEEIEQIDLATESRRRRRIAAGNLQQLLRLPGLLHPRLGGVALAFASGKALRVIMPIPLLIGLVGSLALCVDSDLFLTLAALQLVGLIAASLGALLGDAAPRPVALAHYIVAGHLMGALGSLHYLRGRHRRPWARASVIVAGADLHVPWSVALAKRAMDIAIAALGLVLTAPLWPLIVLAIRLDSPGPVLFRQRRIGRALPDRTMLFEMIKFRSMRIDAEAGVGAVWATRNDPRVTRVGRWLRKTRLDEIPQLINVLRGDMAIVGPRPERPGIQARLEAAVPFFAERTSGLRPGITGLAQVNQDYDRDIEDVRRKALFDHAYAMRLARFADWLRLDATIMLRTLATMALGRGQ